MHSQIDAILFDFDGVLADTEPLHWRCWNEALEPMGVSVAWAAYQEHCIGISDREFLTVLGAQAQPPRTVDELWPRYPIKKQLFRDAATTGSLIPDEMKNTLEALPNVRLAVVTSSSKTEIEAILLAENVLHLFDTVVYGDDVTNLKPDPEPYLTAMSRLGAKHAIAVEDSKAGQASALAAGCELIAVEKASDTPGLLRHRFGL